jgi:hypothetical protein
MERPPGYRSCVTRALARFQACSDRGRKPVIFSSFGKDSLCLISLARDLGLDIPVAYFELGAIPAAHRFAKALLCSDEPQVTVIQPHATLLVAGQHGTDAAYRFHLSCGDAVEIVGATFDDTAGSELRCALQSGVTKRGAHPPYDWSLIITGRRNVDYDPTLGSLALDHPRVSLPNGAEILMPILDWTDQDVAFYLFEHGHFRPDPDRYEISNGTLQNRVGTLSNPDHAPVCIRCLTAQDGRPPQCPLALPEASGSYRVSETRHFKSGEVPATIML